MTGLRKNHLRGHDFYTHDPQLVSHARSLRRTMTAAETKLWSKLSRSQMGYAFRRQHPIGNYIADFACTNQKLIVELDGGQHNEHAAATYDSIRTTELEKLGYRVLRFWNNDVLENSEGVCEIIRLALTKSQYE